MQKKLTARVQKLSKKLPSSTQRFSSTLVIEPDNQEALEKRGTLYTVFDISSGIPLDPLLVTKIVHDVLHDSYYSYDTVSPIQSLEKAIVTVKDKVMELPDTTSSGMLDFNILAAALWGNVLYMVQFGKGGSFLVRDSSVKPVNSATEGNFSEASGVVRGEDVVILGTQSFIDIYSPEDLVSGAVSFSVGDLPEKASALLIKFEATADFTAEEQIDFGLQSSSEEVPVRKRKPSTKVKPKEKRLPPVESTLTIAKKVPPKLPKITLRSTRRRGIKPIYIVIGAVALMLGASIYWNLKNRSDPSAVPDESAVVEDTPSEGEGEETTKEGVPTDEDLKINRISPEVFYDIKIVDENASPTDIVALDNSVVVVDRNSGKIFTSGITTPKFSDEGTEFFGIHSPTYFGGDLIFVDDGGYKVYSSGEVTESYSGDSLGPTAAYLSFVYSVSEDKITKYSKGDDSLDGNLWGQSLALDGAVSMAIDGSIYILKSDGSLLRFFSGEQDNFEVTGLDKPFSNPTKVVKDINLENIYVADTGNARIVVLSEDGQLVAQYLSNAEEGSWGDIKGVGVTRDEKTLFVLNGSKVYKVEL